MKDQCVNGCDDGMTRVVCACPDCNSNGLLEIDELRRLYRYMVKNVESRTRPPKELLDILARIEGSTKRGDV